MLFSQGHSIYARLGLPQVHNNVRPGLKGVQDAQPCRASKCYGSQTKSYV